MDIPGSLRIKIEVIDDFSYISIMENHLGQTRRRGARRKADVPASILAALARGETETVNLMEWLAADMSALARSVAKSCTGALRRDLATAADKMEGQGVTGRLKIAGEAIAGAIAPASAEFDALAGHSSDLVRQWACYAVSSAALHLNLKGRLSLTLRFAADRNMSVREAAWMAFRPHLQLRLDEALRLLEPVSRASDSNQRRFAVEVTRPRSVWGGHVTQLKRSPQMAVSLLENVRQDQARYVQLAVGNWLNDASKTRPDWVRELSERWMTKSNPATAAILRRGLRTLARAEMAGEASLSSLISDAFGQRGYDHA